MRSVVWFRFPCARHANRRSLQEILDHCDLSTTLIYRRSRDERKWASVQALDYGIARTFCVPGASEEPQRNAAKLT